MAKRTVFRVGRVIGDLCGLNLALNGFCWRWFIVGLAIGPHDSGNHDQEYARNELLIHGAEMVLVKYIMSSQLQITVFFTRFTSPKKRTSCICLFYFKSFKISANSALKRHTFRG